MPWVAGFPFPDWERDYEFVCLRAESGLYPIEEGRFISSQGLSADVSEYENYFEEIHVAHSTALQSRIKGRGPYLVGPMARMELNFDRLSPAARALSEKHDFVPPFRNPFKSIVARAVELFYVCEEAIRIIESYEQPKESGVAVPEKSGMGYGATEAPRGVLYHRYRLGEGALIEDAKIVPPTSQNQKSIEGDLASFVESHRHGKKGAHLEVRANDSQLRPVYFLRDPLSRYPVGGNGVKSRALLLGIGNTLRRDDGVGIAVAKAIESRKLPGVDVVAIGGEELDLMELWHGYEQFSSSMRFDWGHCPAHCTLSMRPVRKFLSRFSAVRRIR